NIGLTRYHLKVAGTVQVPMGAPDMAPYVAAATAHGADALALILPQEDGTNFIQAAKAAGFHGIMVSDAIDLLRDINSGFASIVDGIYSVDEFLPASSTSVPAVRQMVNQVRSV